MNNLLLFVILPEEYRQLAAYRDDVDLRIIRYQLEERGEVTVVWRHAGHGEEQVRKINHLPLPGEAEPFSGASGGGWRYTFHPLLDGGCELAVARTSLGFFPSYPDPIDPLHMVIDNDPCLGCGEEPGTHMPAASFPNHEAVGAAGMVFQIPAALYARFAQWAGARAWTEFDFAFSPLTTGTIIQTRRRWNDEWLNLTQDVEF